MPYNLPFSRARDVISTSRNSVRGIPSDDNDNKMSILTIKTTLEVVKIMCINDGFISKMTVL